MSYELPETFDPQNQEGTSWDLLPNGEYVAEVIEAAVMQPKTATATTSLLRGRSSPATMKIAVFGSG
jgi:hypothetical protein